MLWDELAYRSHSGAGHRHVYSAALFEARNAPTFLEQRVNQLPQQECALQQYGEVHVERGLKLLPVHTCDESLIE